MQRRSLLSELTFVVVPIPQVTIFMCLCIYVLDHYLEGFVILLLALQIEVVRHSAAQILFHVWEVGVWNAFFFAELPEGEEKLK